MTIRSRRQARELGRKGGQARAAKLRARHAPLAPYAGSFSAFLELAGMAGPSWSAAVTLWKAADAEPLSDAERDVFTRHAGDRPPPARPVRELVIVAGRRSAKSRTLAARAVWTGIRRDWRAVLARGEVATVPVVAADREQAAIVLGYVKAILELPALAPYVGRVLRHAVELRTGATVKVVTCSYRSVRGLTCPLVAGDEVAFWRTDDGAASPDAEVLAALRPTQTTLRDALLVMASTPYSRSGALWQAYERSFGRDDPRTLVWCADTVSMNPAADAGEVAAAFDADPVAALAEYGQDGRVAFRSDVSALFDAEAVRACVVPGRRELPPVAGAAAVGFCDPSGGSADSMTLAVAFAEGERATLALVREVRPPFDPDSVTADFAAALKAYGLATVTGDRYAAGWVTSRFAAHGVAYVPSPLNRSELYLHLLPALNGRRVALLEHGRLAAQLAQLERHTGRGTGRDVVDHPVGGHDDVSNCVAGALVLALRAGETGELAADQVAALDGLTDALAVAPPLGPLGGARWATDHDGMSDEEVAYRGQHPERED